MIERRIEGRRCDIGAACLCGVGYTVALLMADQAFLQGTDRTVAKIGVLIGSTLAAALGALIILTHSRGAVRSAAAKA